MPARGVLNFRGLPSGQRLRLYLAVVAGLSVPAAASISSTAGADVRVTRDDTPGSYTRYDGETDEVMARCSTARRQQQEASVAVDPRDPRVMVVGSMDACISVRNPIPLAQAQNIGGIYRSANRGRTWAASLLPGYPGDESPEGEKVRQEGNCISADPTLDFDRRGRLFYGYLCPDLVGPNPQDFYMFVATYDRDGSRYVRTVRADSPPEGTSDPQFAPDKPNLTVDQSSSRHRGTIYMVWTQCARTNVPPCADGSSAYLQVARSTDHGQTFHKPVDVPRPDAPFPQFADISVGPDGVVHIAFRTRGGEPGDHALWYSRSADGGVSFSDPIRVATIDPFDSRRFASDEGDPLQGAPCGDGPFACASGFTYGPFRSLAAVAASPAGAHVAYNARVDGQSRVFVRTTRDGRAWGPETPVDPIPWGHQWNPDIVEADGQVSVIFMDSRRDSAYSPARPPGNTAEGTNPGPAVDAYAARSVDGRRPWRSSRLSSQSHQPNYETYLDARVPWLGDYIYASAVPGGSFGIWPDTRDVRPGDDTRPDSEDNGFDVHAPCTWVPNTVNGPPSGYLSPSGTAPCLSEGGLDVNVYGAPLPRPRLRLAIRPRRVAAGAPVRVRFRVRRDGWRGRPVRGATVRFAGKRRRTDARGHARMSFPALSAGRHTAYASKRGFRGGRASLRAVRMRR